MRRLLAALWHQRATVLAGCLLVLGGGVMAFRALPRAVFPDVDFPRISIVVSNGYTPVPLMVVRVTDPLEQAAKGLPDVTLVRSQTSVGLSKIHVFFDSQVSPATAFLLLQARMAEIALPQGAHESIRLMTPNIYPFAEYALVSNHKTSADLRPWYAFTVRPALLNVRGVYTVSGIGRGWPELAIDLDPTRLAELGLRDSDILGMLRAHQGPYFAGVHERFHTQFLLTSAGRPADAAALGALPIPLRGGDSVPLASVAHLAMRPPPRVRGAGVAPWAHALLIEVAAQANANVERVSADVARAMARLQSHLPPGVHLVSTYDLSHLIASSLADVWWALALGTLVTLGVLVWFLRRLDMALSAMIVVPLSLAATLILLKTLHLGLNIMTLGGLTAAIGLLVDHAIVVIEQASHAAGDGPPDGRRERALAAAAEVLPTMTFATLTSAVVFVPLVFLGGTVGILFRQMAVALVISLILSQAVAILVTPVLAITVLDRTRSGSKPGPDRSRTTEFYQASLDRALTHPSLGWLVGALLALIAALMVWRLPTAFLPAWDEGLIAVPFRTPVGRSVSDTLAAGKRLMAIARAHHQVKAVSLVVGESLGNPRATPNKGDLVIALKADHPQSTEALIHRLRHEFLSAEPELLMLKLHQILVTQLGNLSGAHSPLDVDLFGPDPALVNTAGSQVASRLKKLSIFSNVSFGTGSSGPALSFGLTRRGLAAGLTPASLAREIREAYWGEPAGYLLAGEQIVPLRVTRPPLRARTGTGAFPDLWIETPNAPHLQPLSTVARISLEASVPFVSHQNLVPYAEVSLHPRQGVGLNQAAAKVRATLATLHLPAGITAHLAGYYREQVSSFLSLSLILAAALGLLFVLLSAQLASLRAALAVLIATALSGTGALLALWLRGLPLDSTAFLGLLLVLAIVVNNGILVFAEARRISSPPDREALVMAASRRLRPILMTMAADVFGFLPLAIGIGHGTDLLKPLATAVMGGLSAALVLSLYLGPALYLSLTGQSARETGARP